MDFKLPKQVTEILNKSKAANYQIYIVGGAVRDLILGREVKDWDFTTDAKPEEILKLFPDGFYNNQFGTVGILTDLGVLEITTMRKDGVYSDKRHPDEVFWTDKIEEDLARRDFTINAIAYDAFRNIIDPFGGRQDLENHIIRAVGDPSKRFKEDALRLMRAVRIATQLEFEIEPKTLQAVKENSQQILDIAWERIKGELWKILSTMNPYIGITALREAGILQIILPELERCFGLKQEGPKHDRVYDIGAHSLLTLKHTPSPDPLIRFAALIHDIGKPDTYKIASDGNVTFFGHEIVGARIAKDIAKRFHLSRKESEKLISLVRWHMFSVSEHQTDSAIRRFIKNVGLENIDDMIALRVGDRLGGGTETAKSWRMDEFRKRIDQVLEKPFSVTDLKINGQDVMDVLKIPPSKKVGEVLNTLFQEVLEDAEKNNRDYLLERISQLKS